jgi:tRNA threonylcarbamoyl adenosine modification protein YeaZ/tRNA threonylcarbamoyl adenosine modification protein YjeE
VAELETTSPEETEKLAARLASELHPGDVVTVSGELGSGKTTFVRGACRSLGVTTPVTSPTFTIGHRYEGRVPVSHLDLYRFTSLSHAEWGDLEPYFDDAVAFIVAASGERSRSSVLILAFDTATSVATSALVRGDTVLGERVTTPLRVLEGLDALLRDAGVDARELEALVVGIGPGSFTGLRMGLATARGLALSLGIRAAGVSTLAALAAGAPDAMPLIDAKRHEVFLEQNGEIVGLPAIGVEAPGRMCVGDGAVRYRSHLERTGAEVPPNDSELHLPRARFHAQLARDFGPAEKVEPVYVRPPDADRMAV